MRSDYRSWHLFCMGGIKDRSIMISILGSWNGNLGVLNGSHLEVSVVAKIYVLIFRARVSRGAAPFGNVTGRLSISWRAIRTLDPFAFLPVSKGIMHRSISVAANSAKRTRKTIHFSKLSPPWLFSRDRKVALYHLLNTRNSAKSNRNIYDIKLRHFFKIRINVKAFKFIEA